MLAYLNMEIQFKNNIKGNTSCRFGHSYIWCKFQSYFLSATNFIRCWTYRLILKSLLSTRQFNLYGHTALLYSFYKGNEGYPTTQLLQVNYMGIFCWLEKNVTFVETLEAKLIQKLVNLTRVSKLNKENQTNNSKTNKTIMINSLYYFNTMVDN